MARLFELQRLLVPVTAARWVVQHCAPGANVITNDLGLVVTYDRDTGNSGWAIPLTSNIILALSPKDLTLSSE